MALMDRNSESTNQILPSVYHELRALARARIAAAGGVSMQPTELVHEAYLKLEGRDWEWENRAHFFAAAAEAIRRVLLDHARARKAIKRAGDRQRVTLSDIPGSDDLDVDILSLSDALSELEKRDSGMAALVRLRFLCGLSLAESAAVLDVSQRTANRQWESARLWLYSRLHDLDEHR